MTEESPEERVLRLLTGIRRFRYKKWAEWKGGWDEKRPFPLYVEVDGRKARRVYADGTERASFGINLDWVMTSEDWIEL
jgi:hypothetical protein